MVAIQIPHRLFEDRKWMQNGTMDRCEESLEVKLLGMFPVEPGANVERVDRRVNSRCFREQNRTIETAAHKHSQRR